MCLAIPSKIVEIDDLLAVVDVMGARRQVNLMLLAEPPALGDFVLVHAGFAIQKVDQAAAEDALKVISAIVEDVEQEIEAEEGRAEAWLADPVPRYPVPGQGP